MTETLIDIICWLIPLDFFLVLLAAALILISLSIKFTINLFKIK